MSALGTLLDRGNRIVCGLDLLLQVLNVHFVGNRLKLLLHFQQLLHKPVGVEHCEVQK